MKAVAMTFAVGVLLLAGCGKEPAPAPAATPRTLPVVVAQGGAPRLYTATGSVVSDDRVEVASRLSGYLREVRVAEGDRVRRGEVLARIDAADVDSAIGQAEAGVAAADAAYRDAQVDRERIEQLAGKGLVSDSDRRKAVLRGDSAREALNQATAALASARAQRDYAEIRSPIDGVVVERVRRAGDLAVPGAPILRLESGNDLLFETTVTEKQVAALKPGLAVSVQVDGIAQPLAGRVARVVPSADPVTRTWPVKIALPPTPGLLPGMFGRADFPLGGGDALVLPRALLVERSGLTGVFVLDAAGTARFRWLRLGREWPDRVEVLAGLVAGERVVDAGKSPLREGDPVMRAGVAP